MPPHSIRPAEAQAPARSAEPGRAAWLAPALAGLALALLVTAVAFGRARARPAAPPVAPGLPAGAVEVRTVRGRSMDGVLQPGQQVRILRGAYDGQPVRRGDLVAVGGSRPLVKFVRGLPGDRFELRRAGQDRQLLLNGAPVTTTRGEPLSLDASAGRMLQLYVDSYGGVIPADAYLVLGNTRAGSFDSTRFGLVHRSDLLGKVVP